MLFINWCILLCLRYIILKFYNIIEHSSAFIVYCTRYYYVEIDIIDLLPNKQSSGTNVEIFV